MSQSKLISFKIEPNLDRMWWGMGHSDAEREVETEKIEAQLLEAYRAYVSGVSQTFEGLREQLRQCQEEFR